MDNKDAEPERIVVEPILNALLPEEFVGVSMNHLSDELDDVRLLEELTSDIE